MAACFTTDAAETTDGAVQETLPQADHLLMTTLLTDAASRSSLGPRFRRWTLPCC